MNSAKELYIKDVRVKGYKMEKWILLDQTDFAIDIKAYGSRFIYKLIQDQITKSVPCAIILMMNDFNLNF